jgi:pyrroline-5-carboxylate reductase
VTGQRDAIPPIAPIPPILLVGCGRMGSALLAGWEADGLQRSAIVDPDPALPSPSASPSVASRHDLVRDIASLPAGFQPSAVVLAVKPQAADAAMAALAERLGDRLGDAVILSIMAGRTLSGLATALPRASGLVRAMPNTPASIGRGISVAVASAWRARPSPAPAPCWPRRRTRTPPPSGSRSPARAAPPRRPSAC